MARKSISYNPQTLDLIFYAGDGSGIRMTIMGPTNQPIDLTGTILAQVRSTREEVDPPDALLGVDMSGASDGVIVLFLTGEQTDALMADLDPGEKYVGVWDAQWTPDGGEPLTLCQGKVECLRDVSR